MQEPLTNVNTQLETLRAELCRRFPPPLYRIRIELIHSTSFCTENQWLVNAAIFDGHDSIIHDSFYMDTPEESFREIIRQAALRRLGMGESNKEVGA